MEKLFTMLFLSFFLTNFSITAKETSHENLSVKVCEIYDDAFVYQKCPSCGKWNDDGSCWNPNCPLYGRLTC